MMRLTFVLLVIAAMVLLGLYLLNDDKKYLQYFKKLIKYSLYLAMVAAVLFLLRRVLYV
jgi:hypothetical protein